MVGAGSGLGSAAFAGEGRGAVDSGGGSPAQPATSISATERWIGRLTTVTGAESHPATHTGSSCAKSRKFQRLALCAKKSVPVS
jgi:hypothetical protein